MVLTAYEMNTTNKHNNNLYIILTDQLTVSIV